MKKTGILNSKLSQIIARMGHTDKLIICDSGLPIPKHAEIVDLALSTNIPRFLDTMEVILQELQIEGAIVAKEMETKSNGLYTEVCSMLEDIPIEKVDHEEFKELTNNNDTACFVRTGEATPFANIILVSGVTFG